MNFRLSLSIALFGWLCALFTAQSVKASPLSLTVQETGGPAIIIDDNGPRDNNNAIGAINADVNFLNAGLFEYLFVTLGVGSNAPVGLPSVLTQTGEVFRTDQAGNASLTITATKDSYLPPNLNPKSMNSGSTDLFTLTASGDSRTFQSFFDPTDTAYNTGGGTTASPIQTHTSPGGPGPFGFADTSGTFLGTTPVPFAVTNRTIISLVPRSVPLAEFPRDQFTGATVVTPIPEPAGIVLILAALIMGLAIRIR